MVQSLERYLEVLKRLGVDKVELKRLLRLFSDGYNVIFTANTPRLRVVSDDPDDDKFIECAIALDCQYVVSGDRHLRDVKSYMGVRILTPREFVDALGMFDLS